MNPAVTDRYTIHVVDDDDGFRNSMLRLLSASGWQAVGHRCAGEFLLADNTDQPCCILLDMCMPGPSGLDLLNALTARDAAPPVIFVTCMVDVPTSVHALRSGAVDYLTKPVQTEALLHSVRSAIALDIERRAVRSQINDARQRYDRLSRRERTVFHGVVAGKLNKQIAGELGTCERTIKAHRARVLAKFEANSLVSLVRSAALLGESATSPERQHDRQSERHAPEDGVLRLRKGALLPAPCTH